MLCSRGQEMEDPKVITGFKPLANTSGWADLTVLTQMSDGIHLHCGFLANF